MTKEYSLKEHGDLSLSTNFKVREFRSRCGSDKILIAPALVTLLQQIRNNFGAAVTINSGYRTPEHNKAVGGATFSRHMIGDAADITVKDVPPLEVCQYAESLMPKSGGIGLYTNYSHVDTRPDRSRWDNRTGKQIVVSGFPGYNAEEPDPVPILVRCMCGEILLITDGFLDKNGTTLAPIREICEAMGHKVEWDGKRVLVIR